MAHVGLTEQLDASVTSLAADLGAALLRCAGQWRQRWWWVRYMVEAAEAAAGARACMREVRFRQSVPNNCVSCPMLQASASGPNHTNTPQALPSAMMAAPRTMQVVGIVQCDAVHTRVKDQHRLEGCSGVPAMAKRGARAAVQWINNPIAPRCRRRLCPPTRRRAHHLQLDAGWRSQRNAATGQSHRSLPEDHQRAPRNQGHPGREWRQDWRRALRPPPLVTIPCVSIPVCPSSPPLPTPPLHPPPLPVGAYAPPVGTGAEGGAMAGGAGCAAGGGGSCQRDWQRLARAGPRGWQTHSGSALWPRQQPVAAAERAAEPHRCAPVADCAAGAVGGGSRGGRGGPWRRGARGGQRVHRAAARGRGRGGRRGQD